MALSQDQKLYQKLDDIRSHVNKSMIGKFVDKIDDKPTSDGKNKTNLTQIWLYIQQTSTKIYSYLANKPEGTY